MHLERWIKINRQSLDALLIRRVTWLHLDDPSKIQRQRFSSLRFIRAIDWRLNARSDGYTQFTLQIEVFFDNVKHSRAIRVIKISRHQSLESLSSNRFYTHFRVHGVLESEILLREKEKSALEHQRSFIEFVNEKSLIRRIIILIWVQSWVRDCVSS